MMLTVGNTSARVIAQKSDKWGRWVSQDFTGRGGKKIAIFSCYQVVYKPSQLGCTTAASQQHSLLIQSGSEENVNPRVAFQQDLRMALREKRNENMEILLLGDINEALTQESHGISAIAEEFNLQNLMTNRHSASPPATYARGRKCLDFALGTNLLSLSLERAGYEAFNERIHSDHRA